MMEDKICKYCSKPEDKQEAPGLQCFQCNCFVHLQCLKRQGTPGDITGDVFFNFVCENCSTTGAEIITRSRVPWHRDYIHFKAVKIAYQHVNKWHVD